MNRVCFAIVTKFAVVVLVTIFASVGVMAQGKTFAMVAKSVDDDNFIAAWQGCQQAAQLQGDDCILLGGRGSAQLRSQAKAIREAVKSEQYDGLAISVISSNRVASALSGVDIPVITFDSPLDQKRAHLSQAYVGIDNLEVGKNLAFVGQRAAQQAKQFCLMTDMHDENLALRVQGVYSIFDVEPKGLIPKAVKPKDDLAVDAWRQWQRCPWNTSDSNNRALAQLKGSLNLMGEGVFVSVGQWPILDVAAYREVVTPFKAQLDSGQFSIVVAIGSGLSLIHI